MDVLVRPVQVDLALDESAHAGADRRGVLGPHAVSETITLSQARRSARSRIRAGKFGEPNSSSPSTISLRLTGRGRPAGGRQVRADTERVEEHLALVVGGAAPVEPAVLEDGLERVGVPAVLAGGRLDVVVAVDQDRGGVVVPGGPLREDRGGAVALAAVAVRPRLPDLDGRETRLLELRREPVGAAADIGGAAGSGPGSRRPPRVRAPPARPISPWPPRSARDRACERGRVAGCRGRFCLCVRPHQWPVEAPSELWQLREVKRLTISRAV
ncbi:hypothetical protein GCM10020221_34950 [Streptomyces thioluteus]|uniref:Uncharacterized protein n=1 Tax=Streptomyces thioluteus TaxID=66431 RepID=A0ABP6JNV4_STRTU